MPSHRHGPGVGGLDPLAAREATRAAHLHYVTDERPGLGRRRAGKGFVYVDPTGHHVQDLEALRRIRSLVIPPAWQEVWISPDPQGHIQATGLDARGRKQYRYHPQWRKVRDATKFHRLVEVGDALPALRRKVAKDLRQAGLPRTKVLGAVVRLLEETCIRVGNEEYAKENHSYGLTTLLDRHAHVGKGGVRFHFRGKSGKEHTIDLDDPALARVVKACQELPGQQLLQYVDERGETRDVDSADVNAYLKEVSGIDMTAKEFRTWHGTVRAAVELRALGAAETQRAAKRNVVKAIDAVAARLGNTRSVCKKSYIHPGVLDAYLKGSLLGALRSRRAAGLSAEEAMVLGFLRRADAKSPPR